MLANRTSHRVYHLIDRRLIPYHAKCMWIQSSIEFIYLYIYPSTAVLFATACEGWVPGKRLRKAITKVQKAARQKPNSKRSEKGRILKSLDEIWAYKNQSDESKSIYIAARDNWTTSRVSWGLNTKHERLKQSGQDNNKQTNSRCWANQSGKVWDGDKSTMSRATATQGVEHNKGRKIETETSQEWAE